MEWLNKGKCSRHSASSRNSEQFVKNEKKKKLEIWKAGHPPPLYLPIVPGSTCIIRPWKLQSSELTFHSWDAKWEMATRPGAPGLEVASETVANSPHPGPSVIENRYGDGRGHKGMDPSQSAHLAPDLYSVTQHLLKCNIHKEAIIYWTNILCVRQKPKYLWVLSHVTSIHVFHKRLLRHREVM